jgi:hypothetical protein
VPVGKYLSLQSNVQKEALDQFRGPRPISY